MLGWNIKITRFRSDKSIGLTGGFFSGKIIIFRIIGLDKREISDRIRLLYIFNMNRDSATTGSFFKKWVMNNSQV